MNATYDVARAAGQDAGNARMRKAGRTAWSRADYNESVRVFERLYQPRPRFIFDRDMASGNVILRRVE